MAARAFSRFPYTLPISPTLCQCIPRLSILAVAPRLTETSELLEDGALDQPLHKSLDPLLEEQSESLPSTSALRKRPFFPKRGQELELVCERLAFKGKGVCKAVDTGFVVLCDRALPGERLIGRISKKKDRYAEAVKLQTLSPHRNAVTAPCEYVADCGGCKMQDLAYESQLQEKEQQVHELICRVGKFDPNSVGCLRSFLRPIVPCRFQFHYRNKMEFSFGAKQWLPKDQKEEQNAGCLSNSGRFALGLHVSGRFDKILSIKKCLLQDHAANMVLEEVHEYCSKNSDLQPYDVVTHEGFLKHLMIRSGRDYNTGSCQLMVNFVTSTFKPAALQPLVHELVNKVPEVVSIVNNVNSSIGNTSVGEQEYMLHGSSTLTENLCGLVFEISANSFFQTNTKQAEVLYRLVEEAAMLQGDGREVVFDLFCGTGTIGLSLARKVRHVYGYEVVPEAVADARRNAQRNGIENATFIQGDLNKVADSFGNEFPHPDVVIAA
eukprot:c27459_g1_i3 orf=270-1751(+)